MAKVTVTLETPERVLRTALVQFRRAKQMDRHTLMLVVAHQETEVKEVRIETEPSLPEVNPVEAR